MWSKDKSWTENFLSSWAVLLLGILAVTSLVLRYVTDPVLCDVPSFLNKDRAQQLREACFQTTELIQLHDDTNYAGDADLTKLPTQRSLHPWVPLALGLAAILCLVPHVIARMLTGLLWLDAHALLKALQESGGRGGLDRRETIRDSAVLLIVGLMGRKWTLTAVAFFRKVMGCVVCLIIVVIIPVLFGMTSLPGSLTSDPFLCVHKMRNEANLVTFRVPCTLPINEVYLGGFTFLFYFFLLLLAASVVDLVYWVGRVFWPSRRDYTLIRALSVISQSNSMTQEDSQSGSAAQATSSVPRRPCPGIRRSDSGSPVFDYSCYQYILRALGMDGRLVLALVDSRCGPLVTVSLTRDIWLTSWGLYDVTSTYTRPPRGGSQPPAYQLGPVTVAFPNEEVEANASSAAVYRKSDEIPISPNDVEVKM